MRRKGLIENEIESPLMRFQVRRMGSLGLGDSVQSSMDD